MNNLFSNPHLLWQVVIVVATSSPLILIIIKWFWNATQKEVKGLVVKELKEDNVAFKNLMHEQLDVIKDTVEVVKDSIIVMKKDNQLSHAQNKQMLDVMMMHIDELKHVKGEVNTLKNRVYKIEKR